MPVLSLKLIITFEELMDRNIYIEILFRYIFIVFEPLSESLKRGVRTFFSRQQVFKGRIACKQLYQSSGQSLRHENKIFSRGIL